MIRECHIRKWQGRPLRRGTTRGGDWGGCRGTASVQRSVHRNMYRHGNARRVGIPWEGPGGSRLRGGARDMFWGVVVNFSQITEDRTIRVIQIWSFGWIFTKFWYI